MNWHLIVSALIVVVIKVIGTTFFLLYFTEIFGTIDTSVMPTESSGTVCPRGWDFFKGSCFYFSSNELPWNKSKEFCEAQESTLAIVNTPSKLEFLQNIAADERYFIGLLYHRAQNRWRWINNSVFNGNVTIIDPSFNCVSIGLSNTYDAASCDINHLWICEKKAK